MTYIFLRIPIAIEFFCAGPIRFLDGRYRFLPWFYYELALFIDLHQYSFVPSSVSPTVID